MLSHQIEFSKALAELYKPISGRPSDPNSYKDEGNPDGIKACEQYEEIVRDLQETISPELDTIETRIIGPATQLLEIMKAVRKTANKRDHKQLDYDRHRATLKKLQEKKEKTPKDEKAVFKAEAELEVATQDFNYFNELLKDELPQFFDLERKFIQPLFTSLYFLQLNIFYTMHERMQNLNIPYFDLTTDVEEGFQRKIADFKGGADELSITKFKKVGHTKPGTTPGESKYVSKYAEAAASRFRRKTISDPDSAAPPPPYSAKPEMDSTTVATSSSGPVASAANVAAAAKSKGPAPPPPKPKPTALVGKSIAETVTALYDYEAQAQGDLSFSAGEVIEIIKKTPNDNEWWIGKIGTRQGQFPGKLSQV